MDIATAYLDRAGVDYLPPTNGHAPETPALLRRLATAPDHLRRVAWEIGERRPGDHYAAACNHVGLAMISPLMGFVYWRVRDDWMERQRRERGASWDGCRFILRLYDVSYLEFNGLNAHRTQDQEIEGLTGRFVFTLPTPGAWLLAEVGTCLTNGEFIPAARSVVVPFAPEAPSRQGSSEALLVHRPGRVEAVGNVWDQEAILRERRKPRLRLPLRLLALAFASRPSGLSGPLADFVTELAAGQAALGHDVHVLVPQSDTLPEPRQVDGVHYHPVQGVTGQTPLEIADRFRHVTERYLRRLPRFDLIHQHEWMTASGEWARRAPTVLSMSSIEATRHSGDADELSAAIAARERQAACQSRCVLTPDWLRGRAIAELGLAADRTHAFGMEGRLPNEWESPLDYGPVKMGVGIGPLDRVMTFVGPLEHAAGVDVLLEALPVVLRRCGNLRLAVVGDGPVRGALEGRAHELGVAWAVRFLGHREGQSLRDLLRASEAVVLPSRYRLPMDDAVVDLARLAGRAVITTHGGPAHLVRHEENGLVTYDNPGSMVWAMDRALGDPTHTERMGQNGRRREGGGLRWNELAGHYLAACVGWFPELTEARL